MRRHFPPSPDKPPPKVVYVSLYGLSTIEEIDAAMLQAIYPALGWKVTKLGARIGKMLLKHGGYDADFKLSEVVSKSGADLYVFDDLERCDAPINRVLGYINQFVEHDDSKVIIIANDAEIAAKKTKKRKEYERRREKLIGKILEVQSAFDEAFNYFCSFIDDPETKTLFQENGSEIASIYAQSKLDNLRILQQTMWDFERFYRALTPKHRQNAEAMTALLRLFLRFHSNSNRDVSNRTISPQGLVAWLLPLLVDRI